MASQVLSGSVSGGSSFSYTNNTGQNVRIIIEFLEVQAGPNQNVQDGTPTAPGNYYEAVLMSLPNSITIRSKSGNTFGKNITNSNQTLFPTEIFLPTGQTISLSLDLTNPIWATYVKFVYNIVVIPEAG